MVELIPDDLRSRARVAWRALYAYLWQRWKARYQRRRLRKLETMHAVGRVKAAQRARVAERVHRMIERVRQHSPQAAGEPPREPPH